MQEKYTKKLYTASLFPTKENAFDFFSFAIMKISKHIRPEGLMILKSITDKIFYEEIISEFSEATEKLKMGTKFLESTFENLSKAFESLDSKKYAQSIISYANKNRPKNYGSVDWFANSCYQDAVILALFAIPVRFIISNILYKDVYRLKNNFVCKEKNMRTPRNNLNYLIRVQIFLRQIAYKLWFETTPFKCIAFRLLTTMCEQSGLEKFNMSDAKDAKDFINFLFIMFNVPELSLDIYGPPYKMKSYPLITLIPHGNVETKMQEQIYANLKNIQETSDFMVFHYIRNTYNYYYDARNPGVSMIPNSGKWNDPFFIDGKSFVLYAVVMFKSEIHYTVIINMKNDKWVYFNDIGFPAIKEYDSFNEAINTIKLAQQEYNIKNSGMLYFYKTADVL